MKALGIAVGIMMAVAGAIWTLQGLKLMDSEMTGNQTWAIVGPIVAGLGVALILVSTGRAGRR